jgi:hypothetical protein
MMYAVQRGQGAASAASLRIRGVSGATSSFQATASRLAPFVVAVATVWFAAALSWGLFGRIPAGHDAVIAARGIVADNMLAWHIWGPVRQYTTERPGLDLVYGHHPFGSFWLIAAFVKVLGRHTFVPRLVPVLLSVATPPLLYGVGRALWGPVPGALAAVTYTVLPISLAFGNFPGFEVPLAFGCLLTAWGYVRFAQRWEPKWMAVSLAGVVCATNSDWEANVFLGVALATVCIAALWAPSRWFSPAVPPVRLRSFMKWWGLAVGITAITLLAYTYNLVRIGAVDNLMTEAGKRARGNSTPLKYVLDSRQYWIDLTFTPLAIAVGKVAAPLLAARILFLGRLLEIFPVAIGITAGVQYILFKNGADVHVYWPMPFAPYAALAVGAVAASALDVTRWVCRRFRRERALPQAQAVVTALVALVPLAILPDGVRALHYARATGGRFNEKGKIIYSDYDKIAALEWFARRMEGRGVTLVHDSIHPTWSQDWVLHRPLKKAGIPVGSATGDERYFFGDMRFMSPEEQQRLAHDFHVIAVGPILFVDRAAPPAPVDGYSFDLREPNAFEWYFLCGVDPVRTVRADPWYTWELRDQYGQTPNPPPTSAPGTPEELRVAHNIAVAEGDDARAHDREAELVDRLRVSVAVPFTDGTSLLGELFTRGVAPALTLYFHAVGPARSDLQFHIDSTVTAKPRFSLVGVDSTTRQVNETFALPARAWKRGYIYSLRSEIRQRPGSERYVGYFESVDRRTAPRLANGAESVTLLDLR